MSKENEMTCDAIVTYADAGRWVNELYAVEPPLLAERLVQVEPALVGVAVDLAKRMESHLLKRGIPEAIAADVADQVTRSGVICAELARRGYQKFIAKGEQGGVA